MSEFTNYGGQQVPALQITTGLYPSTATPLDIRTYVKTKSILESSDPVGCALHIGMQIYVEDTNEYVTIVGKRPNTSGAQWNHWIFDIIIPQLIASLEADKQTDPSTYAQIKSGVYTTENLINYLFIKCGGPITPVHSVTINFLYADETVAREPVVLTILEGAPYSFNVYEITGYEPDREVVTGTMGNQDIVENVIYTAVPYTLTYMVEHGGETYQTYSNVLYNTAVEVPSTPEPPREGLVFDYWEYVPELIDGTYMPASDVTAYGIWAEVAPDCTVTVNVVPTGSGETTGQGDYSNGDNVVLTATASEGYNFTNWVDADSSEVISTSNPCTIESIDRNWNINANFSLEQYSVTATVDPQGSGTVTGTGTYSLGADVTLVAEPATGYSFKRWTENGSALGDSPIYSILDIDADHDLVAEFKIDEYNVTATVDPVGGGTVTGTGTYEYGQNVTLTATASNGYSFSGWLENGTMVSSSQTYTINAIDADHALTAKFDIDQYTVTATVNPNGSGTVSGAGTYNTGDTATLIASANEGYTFANWTENGTVVSSNTTYQIQNIGDDHSVTANFTLNQYTVSLDVNPNGSGTVTGTGTYNFGSNVNLTATPTTGYQFVNWTDGATVVSTNASYTIGGIRENISYTANFSKIRYEVEATANPQNSGTVTGTGTYEHGTNATLTATPATGYQFVNWTENDVEVSTRSEYTISNISSDHRLVANFEGVGYTVTTSVDPQGSGSVEGGGTYASGSNVTLIATPATGYLFSYWQDTSVETPLTSNPRLEINNLSRDMTIVAHFSQLEQVTVSLSVDPANSGSVRGAGTYYVGDNVEMSASANSGYNFSGWYNTNDQLVSANNPYTVSGINQNLTLVAKFSAIQAKNVYAFGMYDADIDAAGGIGSMSFSGKPCRQFSATDNVYAAEICEVPVAQLNDTATYYAVVAIPNEFAHELGANFFKGKSLSTDEIINYGISGYRNYQPITRTIDGSQYYVVVSADIPDDETTTLVFGNTSGLTSWRDALEVAEVISDNPNV